VKDRFKLSVQNPIALAVAVISGVVMLASYLGFGTGLREALLSWVMIMAAAALIIGVFNLTSVHARNIVAGKGVVYSLALIGSVIVTFAIKFLDQDFLPAEWVLSNLIIPVESALMAVLLISLTYAAIRLVSQRPNVYSVVFVFVVVFTLIANTSLGIAIPFIQEVVKPLITQVLASAGARGILIGVALGTITTGLRVIMGFDRPYGG
jgi:hypothetical protein